MSDQELRDLLHDRVADVTMPDASGAAWVAGRRRRRRRTTGAVAGAVAAVVLAALVVDGTSGADRSGRPVLPASSVPDPAPSETVTPWAGAAGSRPDGSYRGWLVYRGPSAAQEATLPRLDSQLPARIDLGAPAPDLADEPLDAALAAYALTDGDDTTRVRLLAPDGSLRSVDVSPVAPLDGGDGTDVSVARETLLSPTGEYLAFPQEGRVLVLRLATDRWRTIETGRAATAWARWLGDTDLWLSSARDGGPGPMYSVATGRRSGGANTRPPSGPLTAPATTYGRSRNGPAGDAQSWTGVRGLPLPSAGGGPAQVLVVEGSRDADDALLVLSAAAGPGDPPRPADCCGVQFWLDGDTVVYRSQGSPDRLVGWRVGTHRLGQVSTIEGYDPASTVVVGSYARIWQR